MPITNSMRVEPVFSTCTARMFHYLPNLSDYHDRDIYDFLTNQFNEEIHKSHHRGCCAPDPDFSKIRNSDYYDQEDWEEWRNGYALYIYIVTQEQLDDGFHDWLPKLGFTEAYEAEKSHRDCREEDSGSLFVYCGQPWTVEEARVKWVNELKVKLGITSEKISERKKYPALLTKEFSSFPKDPRGSLRFFGDDRRRLVDFVKDRTGGFDISTDREILLKSTHVLTDVDIIERATAWREGRI